MGIQKETLFERSCYLVLCVCRWVLKVCTGHKIGVYLSDISGAFDRVFKEFLMAKLYRAGLPDFYLNFLSSYLEPRIGKVAVEGTLSDLFELSNTVLQGTVLGPTLWNTFFGDVAVAATAWWHRAAEPRRRAPTE